MSEKPAVLIIEETLLSAETLSQCLDKDRYRVIGIATDIRTAAAFLQKENADLILAGIGADALEDAVAIVEAALAIRRIPTIYISTIPWKSLLRRVKKTNPAAILSKPLRQDDLLAQVELALAKTRRDEVIPVYLEESDDIFVPVARGFVRVALDDILYLLSDSNYSKLYLTQEAYEYVQPGKSYNYLHVNIPMGTLYQKLPPSFYKLSRFEVVNLRKIDSIGKGYLAIRSHELTIPENGRTALLSQLRVMRRK